MCPDRGRDTRPTSPRTRTWSKVPSTVRFTAPESSETVYSGALPGAESRLFDVGKAWGGVLHAKYFLVDDDGLYLGSQNFDWRALGQMPSK